MVVHQYISVYGDPVFNNHLLQQTQVVAPILVIDEDCGAVNPAMCDVQRHTRKLETRASRHRCGPGVESVQVFRISRSPIDGKSVEPL